jgi:hypothetical protein
MGRADILASPAVSATLKIEKLFPGQLRDLSDPKGLCFFKVRNGDKDPLGFEVTEVDVDGR